jgi:hypothetical protein
MVRVESQGRRGEVVHRVGAPLVLVGEARAQAVDLWAPAGEGQVPEHVIKRPVSSITTTTWSTFAKLAASACPLPPVPIAPPPGSHRTADPRGSRPAVAASTSCSNSSIATLSGRFKKQCNLLLAKSQARGQIPGP